MSSCGWSCNPANETGGGTNTAPSGRVAFGKMESVTFGKPFAEAAAAEVESRGGERVFLMVSGTLNRETGELAA